MLYKIVPLYIVHHSEISRFVSELGNIGDGYLQCYVGYLQCYVVYHTELLAVLLYRVIIE